MLEFKEDDFREYISKLSNDELLAQFLSVREMVDVTHFLDSLLDDILMQMEDAYLWESFFRFLDIVNTAENLIETKTLSPV